jgi:hypothetical protein
MKIVQMSLGTRGWLAIAFICLALVGATPSRAGGIAIDQSTAQQEAEAHKAIAEADRAELLAGLPPSSIKPLQGAVDTSHFGAAGLVKAFDLAQQLARQVCDSLPTDRKTSVYDPAVTQSVVAARTVNDGIGRLSDDLSHQNKDLQAYIEAHTPPGSQAIAPLALALTVLPATVRAAADFTALFKSDVTAAGIAYGDGARSLFVTALAHTCPDKIVGLGSGYLGELDASRHEKLLARVRTLAAQRGEFANRIEILQRLADAAKGDEKKNIGAVANAAAALLKNVDSFIDSLRAGETNDRSPLFNTARYSGYASRIEGALVLDFDLRLEGLSIVKDGLFSGQKLRLAGVAFLWSRVYEGDGRLRFAKAVRRVTQPVEVDLRGADAGREFWGTGE